jgi:hypothetical protein
MGISLRSMRPLSYSDEAYCCKGRGRKRREAFPPERGLLSDVDL